MYKVVLFLSVCMSTVPVWGLPVVKELGLSNEAYYAQAQEIEKVRASRQLDYPTAERMLREKNTILIDARGDMEFKRLHLKGAMHLSYADMTFDKLAQVIPDKNTRVILYCDKGILIRNTRMFALSGHAFVDMTLSGYKNLYEIRQVNEIRPYQALCQAILDMPFEGDAVEVARVKQEATQCLSSQ